MLFEACLGDAYGAGWEYVDEAFYLAHPNDLSGYVAHPKHKIGEGRYTDDGESSTAIAEVMMTGPGPHANPFMDENEILPRERIADWFVKAFHREQRLGYAGRYHDFLTSVHTGAEFLARINPQSDKSGAAMRGWVMGLYTTPGQVMKMAAHQARLTHDTPGGIHSAQAAALMTHFFAYKVDGRRHLADFITARVAGPWQNPRTTHVGSSGMDSVHAAVQAVMMHDTMSGILKQCVDFHGDVDTVATIALGAASLSAEIKQDLPQVLIDGLEQGEWGAPYLRRLDSRLLAWKAM